MSWFDGLSQARPAVRSAIGAVLVILVLSVGSCGFRPLYGVDRDSAQPSVIKEFSAIDISTISDKTGQELRNYLIDSLHPGGAAADYRYRLSLTAKEIDLSFGLQENATSTRGQVRFTVRYILSDYDTGETLTHETLRVATSYNVLINQFGTLLSTTDARDKALQQVSQDITKHLALYFSSTH